MTAVIAMFVDAYRQLNTRKLFWITLGLSAVVVIFYASIGFSETGMFMLFGLSETESPVLREGSPAARMLYRGIFSSFIVGIWLAWAAVILALISTTTIFPDFVAEGSVELVLSKPITRLWLFVVKYLTSLLFVTAQVTLFCVGVFFCLAWRLGEWNWIIFAAIPLITLMYSYIYSINVLVGVLTRSALAALLLCIVFWFTIFSINLSHGILTQFHTEHTVSLEHAEADVEGTEQELRDIKAKNPDANPSAIETRLEMERSRRDAASEVVAKLDPWHTGSHIVVTVLPKTSQTVGLLDRWLTEESDVNLIDILSGNVALDDSGQAQPRKNNQQREVEVRLLEEERSRGLGWILGTSLIFEAIVLGLAAFFFVRRDY
jgi:hypothetical protein